MEKKDKGGRGGLPPMPSEIYLARGAAKIDWKRIAFMALGGGLFLLAG